MTPRYERDWVPSSLATGLFKSLKTELAWLRREGAPRYEYWDTTKDEPYTYGRGRGVRTYEPQKPHPDIALVRNVLRDQVSRWNPEWGDCKFEGCFLNRYVGGRDWLGWHADDDPGIDHTKPIAVVTLGDTRELQWKLQGAKGLEGIHGQRLRHGSLFLMPPGMQQTHFHRIPKSVDLPVPHERISLTYRCLL